MKPVTIVVSYQTERLLVPQNYTACDIYEYIKAGLQIEPRARMILWNDRIRRFEVDPIRVEGF